MKFIFSIVVSFFILNTKGQSGLTVHEWGTFTSHYTDSGTPYQNVHKVLDEKAPDFVHFIDFENCDINCTDRYKDDYWFVNRKLELDDISIKMETPVLYFYSKKEITDLEINVGFPMGSISEFYPLPIQKEDLNYVKSHVKFKDRAGELVDGINIVNSIPYLSFKNYYGYAKWRINILSPNTSAIPSNPDSIVSNVWLAPRKTASNIIESGNEREKYIFYRGLASFTNPVIPKYTKSSNLLVTNTTQENLKYVLVYEITKDGRRFIWDIKGINANESVIFQRNNSIINDNNWNSNFKPKFIEALVESGLYKDEAEAMLNTWNQSYFGKPGIKIFWITPRSFTDKILPISFSIQPEKLERVMIGRTEIDTFNPLGLSNYFNDAILPKSQLFNIFPNPSKQGELFLTSANTEKENVKIEILDLLGKSIKIIDLEIQPYIKNTLPVENLSAGIYFIKIYGEQSIMTKRILFQ
jgi:predicted transcriptional regulator